MSISDLTKISMAVALAVSVAGCAVVDRVKTDLALANAQSAYQAGRYTDAADVYREASNAGSGEASYQLSLLYLNGKGLKKDTAAGVNLMRQASQQRYLPADVSIGLWTLGGVHGIRRDANEGARIILGAAQAGEPNAMRIMGSLYMKGRGVKPDANQALEWFKKANAAGVPVDPNLLTLSGVQAKMAVRR